MAKTLRSIDGLRREIRKARKRGKTIGLVPTMGYLHAGHLALVDECRSRCDVVVVSIFVNPTQFGPGEDLDTYPRNLARDRRLLKKHGCDVIFAPPVKEIYGDGFSTVVRVKDLSDRLCGRSRTGHFDGVATVVLKLFLAAMPDLAFFGEKDYQQLVIIRRMVEDLALPIRIESVPTVREKDGLALSSRNTYLGEGERAVGSALFRSLELARLLIASGERRTQVVKERVITLLVDSGVDKVEYVAIVHPETLDEPKYISGPVRVAVAAWVGRTRLIDNAGIEPPAAGKPKRIKRGVIAVILAAGEGKRMKSSRPKLLCAVAGKPMLEHVVGAARGAGIDDMFAIVGHRSGRLEPVIKKLGVEMVRQDVQRGTGHAVLQVYPHLVRFEGDILVLSGDTPLIRPATVARISEAHQKHSNTITFATAVVPDSRGYGRIQRDRGGRFLRIVEERDADGATRKIREINAGLYCFRAPVLFDALLTLTADNAQMEYYLPDAIASMKSRGARVEAVVIDDHTEILGVNTPEELRTVREIYSRRKKDGHNKRGMENGVHRKGR